MNLFEPIIEEARRHPHFRGMLHSLRKHDREEFLRWAKGFPDRDGKLIEEFQISFNTVFWEIYLFAVFKTYDFKLDWSNRSPDFSVTFGSSHFTVEAVTANAAAEKSNEWDKIYSPCDFADFNIDRLNKEAMIRLSNSIHSKYRRYKAHYATMPHVRRSPFVLAVGPFEQPFFNHQYNRGIRAVLYDQYVDEPAFTANPEKYPNGPPHVKLNFVRKDNGSDIELGVFNDDRMQEISAIIFSCTATWGKVNALAPESPDQLTTIMSAWYTEPFGDLISKNGTQSKVGETITDGLQVYHNPNALHPLPPNIFRRKGVVQEYFDFECNKWIHEEAKSHLVFRMVMNGRCSDEEI
ncbi:hypothetical protein GO003_011750 [Methylicorpusculum oleiharenae]|uniref:hypothetical protein n=1 Tax=Methylicorpusculum oleiharenae TaxID=1338687 RepID=UPI00135B73C1|nr:hypothetical protein [Methylicorpusculum oleiharenae]MCD2451068.1 hypothetical protein [Methylicorpusculum oleiharenae]